MTRAIIFDFDGTIVDTETPAHRSTLEIWQAHGIELGFDWWIEGLGTDRQLSWVRELERLVGRPLDHHELLEQRRRIKDQMTDAQPALPGVVELLEAARGAGIPLAVGSSSAHEWVDRHLDRIGLDSYFDHVVCRDDVGGKAKPAPDVFLRALELLDVGAEQAVVVEDSHNGVAAANAAGIRSVVIPNPLLVHQPFPGADLRLGALDDHSPTDLLDILFP